MIDIQAAAKRAVDALDAFRYGLRDMAAYDLAYTKRDIACCRSR